MSEQEQKWREEFDIWYFRSKYAQVIPASSVTYQPAYEGFLAAKRQDAERIAELERKLAEQQAKIDSLMLEYCPEEMTPEQIAEFESKQKQVKS